MQPTIDPNLLPWQNLVANLKAGAVPQEIASQVNPETGQYLMARDGSWYNPGMVRELDPYTGGLHYQYAGPGNQMAGNANIWTVGPGGPTFLGPDGKPAATQPQAPAGLPGMNQNYQPQPAAQPQTIAPALVKQFNDFTNPQGAANPAVAPVTQASSMQPPVSLGNLMPPATATPKAPVKEPPTKAGPPTTESPFPIYDLGALMAQAIPTGSGQAPAAGAPQPQQQQHAAQPQQSQMAQFIQMMRGMGVQL